MMGRLLYCGISIVSLHPLEKFISQALDNSTDLSLVRTESNPHIIATFPIDGEFQTLAFHPSGYQLGIAAFKRSSWDAVTFVWDQLGVIEDEKRRTGVESDGKRDVGVWTVRKDIKLGDRNYRLRDRRGKEWGVREVRLTPT